jgi:hypothetical protein
VAESLRGDVYTVELAEEHIANLRGATDLLGEAHLQTDVTDSPSSPAAGHIMYASTGHMKYVSGGTGDGVTYNTGRNTNGSTGPLSLTTSFQTVPGLTISLGVGTYTIHSQLLISVPGAGGTISYQATASGGLTASNGRIALVEVFGGNTASDYTTLGSTLTGSSPAGATNRVSRLEGLFVISVAGTLNIQVKQAATANATVVQYGSYLEAFPVT